MGPAVMMTLRLKLAAAAVAAGLALGVPVAAQDGLAGAYLAGRQALTQNDFIAAAEYLGQALESDPANPVLMESLMLAHLALGDVALALPVAQAMQGIGVESQTRNLVQLAEQLERRAWDQVRADLAAGRDAGPLLDGLVSAWSQLGLGLMSEALSEFDALAEEEGLAPFALYHKALALASVGDLEGAEAIFTGLNGAGLAGTRRGVQAYAEILSQLERPEVAIAVLKQSEGQDAVLDTLRARLEAGEVLPFTIVRDPGDGVAEVFFTVALVLASEGADGVTLVHARMAEYLRPDHIDAMLMTAGLLEQLGQYELATAAYGRIPSESPAFPAAEMGRAESLYRDGRSQAAVQTMEELTRTHGELAAVHGALGDMHRRDEDFAAAIPAYDRAIEMIGEPEARHWVIFYSRGIAHEREGQWPEAEADFRRALDLNPGQPLVLNYLGYSYVEKNENLEEALEMIEQAVAARPDDGYITDSLGWALYRLGRYEEAVVHMERAAELMATDPLINDHLGDVYWAVGRQLEARFQWRRALSFGPEEADEQRVRRKLEVGLDAVLAEEGAPPLRMTANGN